MLRVLLGGCGNYGKLLILICLRKIPRILFFIVGGGLVWISLYRFDSPYRSSPLSPLLGAFYLYELDKAFEQEDCFYIRYMDDILILTKTRWKNRRAIAKFNAIISALGLEQHPDKSSMGKISKGFDFLGLQFESGIVLPCKKAIQRFVDKLNRLYEQEPDASKRNIRLGQYTQRWLGWYFSITMITIIQPS